MVMITIMIILTFATTDLKSISYDMVIIITIMIILTSPTTAFTSTTTTTTNYY